MTRKNEGILLIAAGVFLPILHYALVVLDAETGWLGGGPGDANIGLGIVGLLVWLASTVMIIMGISYLLNKKK